MVVPRTDGCDVVRGVLVLPAVLYLRPLCVVLRRAYCGVGSMTEERARLYENAVWLLSQIDAECEAGEANVGRIAAAAEAAAFILAKLRRSELTVIAPRRRAKWEVSADAVA
jgi:hypothetical protein